MPFTLDQFLDVFRRYNTAVWPAQFILFAVGLATIASGLIRGGRHTVPIGLAVLWAWSGSAYHLAFFAEVNPAARLFGALFVTQAAIWLLALWRSPHHFQPSTAAARWAGAVLLTYAMVGYPALNVALGHAWPAMPTFGAPCPTTIATFGLLCWASPRPPWWAWVIPLAWAAVGTSAALALGMHEDLGLAVSALAAVTVARFRGARLR